MERKLENEGSGETLENKKTREMETKNTTVKMLVLKMWVSQEYTNMQACAQAYRDCVKAKSWKVTSRRDLAAGTLKLRKIKSVGHLVEAPRDLHIENTRK